MGVSIIVQARMGSTRLPGKILKKVLDKPLLSYQIERLKRAKLVEQIIVATTEKKEDDVIVELSKELNVEYFRGEEEDVLARYYYAAKSYNSNPILRVTSDCPLIDPEMIDSMIQYYLHGKFDCVANGIERTFPRGLDIEICSFSVLEETFLKASQQYQREHVTPFIYENKAKYKIGSYINPVDYSDNRWTVDTKEDFDLIKKILESLYPQNPYFTWKDCLSLLNENPEWKLINSHIEQKKLGQ